MEREALIGAVIVIRAVRPGEDPDDALMAAPNREWVGELVGSGFVCESPLTVVTAAHPAITAAEPEDVQFITLGGRGATCAAIRVHPDAGVAVLVLERAAGMAGHLQIAFGEPGPGAAVLTAGYSADPAESGQVLDGVVQRGADRDTYRVLETTLDWPASGRGGPVWRADTQEVVGVAGEHGIAMSAAMLADWVRSG